MAHMCHPLACFSSDQKDRIHKTILHFGSKAQHKGDTRNSKAQYKGDTRTLVFLDPNACVVSWCLFRPG